MNINFRILMAVCAIFIVGCGGEKKTKIKDEASNIKEVLVDAPSKIKYPAAKIKIVKEILHGVEIEDPYRWLEDDNNPDVQKWQEKQNAFARNFLDNIKGRDKIEKRIAGILKVNAEGSPVHKGKYYFQKKRKASQDQAVLYVSTSFPGEQRVLVNPNATGDDNTVTLDWWYPSWDGEFLAYGLSSSGSERSTLYVIETATGRMLKDRIPNTRSARVAWLADGRAFYYSRRPDPNSKKTWFNRVYYHKLGDNWKNDPIVFGEESNDDAIHSPVISPDGRRLVIIVYRGAGGSEVDIHYKAIGNTKSKFVPVAVGKGAAFFPDVKNDKLVVLTNYKAPKYRVIKINYDNLDEKNWKTIIDESEDTIDQILLVRGRIVVKTMHHATSRLLIYDETGKKQGQVHLPTLGSVYQLRGQFDDEDFFYGFTSFFHAGYIFRYSVKDDKYEQVAKIEVPVDPNLFTVSQVFYKSKDGTRVPMFIARLIDTDLSKPKPTLLTGYGGFNIALTPSFLGKYLPFLEAGGVFAQPNMRGGSEYGEDWHKGGMLKNKQNVFDDFIGAAEYLISEKITTPAKLAIRGGSNGGLLVGAAMTQRPELFKAVICLVPLLDMLRYHKFLLGKLWVPEYGQAQDPEQFKYIHAYSPYHNVRKNVSYPATLFLTAESDSRVAPLHARKMAALIQAQTTGSEPILLHVESKAGHGQGKPVSKRVEDIADWMAFAMERVGLTGTAGPTSP